MNKLFSKNRLIYLISLILIIVVTTVAAVSQRGQVFKESIQVQILENLYKPLDLIYLPYAFLPNKLPKYNIEVSRTDLRKLDGTLPTTKLEEEFNQKRIVEDRLYVPIKFTFGDREFKANMTVRGVNPPHWLGEKKSLRVRIDKDENAPFSGIDFLVPEDRYFVDNAISYHISKKLNLFSLKPSYANVVINGKNFGVYETLQDEQDNANIELAKLSTDDLFLRDESKPQVIADPKDSSYWSNLFSDAGTWQLRNSPEDQDGAPFSPLEKLKDINKLNGQQFFDELEKVVDMDQLDRYIAHNYIMGDWHQGNQHNQSLIWLKEIAKFWFIPNDNSVNPIEVLRGFHFNDFTEKIIKNPQRYWARNKILWELTKDVDYKNNLKAEIDEKYNLLKGPVYQDSLKPFRFVAFRSKIRNQKNVILANFESVNSYFRDYYIETYTKNYSGQNTGITAAVEFKANAYFQPLIKSLKVIGENTTDQEVNIYFDKNENEIVDENDELIVSSIIKNGQNQIDINKPLFASHFLDSPIDKLKPTAVSKVIVAGSNEEINIKELEFVLTNSLTGQAVELQNNLIDSSFFISKPPLPNFVEKTAENKYQIGPGGFRVTEDLFFEKGELVIFPGTTLSFDPGTSLISRAKVTARGTSANPIILTKSQEAQWGGLLIAGPNEYTNVFENVRVEYGMGVNKYGFKTTGTVAIHFSNAQISNNHFSLSQNDDAINVKHGKVTITNNTFENTTSDAIDLDTAEGVVTGNNFKNIGTGPTLGDAIDLSFSTVTVRGNEATKISDKCVSVGERSHPIIEDNTFDNCSIGIAVKDGSTAQIKANVIKNCTVGIFAYIKKYIYVNGGIAYLESNQLSGNKKDFETDNLSSIQFLP